MQTKHLPLRVSLAGSTAELEMCGALKCLRCCGVVVHYNKTYLIFDALSVNSKHLDDSLLGANAFCNSPFTELWHRNK